MQTYSRKTICHPKLKKEKGRIPWQSDNDRVFDEKIEHDHAKRFNVNS